MKTIKTYSNDILFLVALYANLFFVYHYVQALKEEHRKTDILIADLAQKLGMNWRGFSQSD